MVVTTIVEKERNTVRDYVEPLGSNRRRKAVSADSKLLKMIRTEDLHPTNAPISGKKPYFAQDGWSNR